MLKEPDSIYKNDPRIPRITFRLFNMVMAEVISRLMNPDKSPMFEPLEQIILNKYTVIKFEKEERGGKEGPESPKTP